MAVKFYAVKQGLKTGVFRTWEECKASVHGYPCADFKSFPTLEAAKAYLSDGKAIDDREGDKGADDGKIGEKQDGVAAYVDGSYHALTGEFSYGVVILLNGEEITFSKKFDDAELRTMRNVAGEIKGAEAAMQYALDHGIPKLVIYHDYEGIAKWCNGAWKANKTGTKAYQAFYEAASRKMEIRFVKVTGHSGDKYNDMADCLAKDALGIENKERKSYKDA